MGPDGAGREKLASAWRMARRMLTGRKPYGTRLPLLRVSAWLVCLLGILGVGLLLGVEDAMNRMEMTLLDARLKLRSQSLDSMASGSDILFVGLDRQTQEYARNHPELGIQGLALPREYVARIVDFLSQAGARTIVMDVEFRSEISEKGDRTLAEAIENAGNVYLASSAELSLREYREKRLSKLRPGDQTDLKLAVSRFVLMPYIDRQVALHSQLGDCSMPLAASGLLPLMREQLGFSLNILQFPPELFQAAWQDRCVNTIYQQYLISNLPASNKHPGIPASPISPLETSINAASQHIPDNLANAMYQDDCQNSLYTQVTYRNRPELLRLLDHHKLSPQAFSKKERNNGRMTYCVINPILEPLLAGAKGMGMTSVDYQGDMMIREIPLIYQGYQGNIYTYLGLRPVLDWASSNPFSYQDNTLQLGHRTVPLNDGRVIINWRNPLSMVRQVAKERKIILTPEELQTLDPEKGSPLLGYGHLYRMISASEIIQALQADSAIIGRHTLPGVYNIPGHPESGLLSFRNKIVIYGDAIKDVHRTPVGATIYGPEIMANLLDMMRQDTDFVQKSPNWLNWLTTICLAVFIFTAAVRTRRIHEGLLLGMVLIVLFAGANFLCFIHFALWMPLVTPMLVYSSVLLSGTVYRYYVHDREKRQLVHVFSKYVSPQVMDKILESPETSLENLSGRRQELTVLFADLRGFTSQCETEDLEQMVRRLNEFFDAMTRVILKHQGTYDKYMGDAVMAFFGAPVDIGNHAAKACACALEMHATLEHLNAIWASEGYRPLALGVGISTGSVIVGNFGSEMIKNFTVMGSTVNLGARFESYTREAGAKVVISEATQQMAGPDFEVKDLGPITVKGFSRPIQAYALEGWSAMLPDSIYTQAL